MIAKINNKILISIRMMVFILMIVFSAIPGEIRLLDFQDNLTRENGSAISLTLLFILYFVYLFAVRGKLWLNKDFLSLPIVKYFLWAGISLLFFPVVGFSLKYYFVGFYKYCFYFLILLGLLDNHFSYQEFSKAMDLGFKISVLFQTAIAMLYQMTGIVIPFLTRYSEALRGGIPRMVGTFSHPGNFSLYIAFFLVYFFFQYFFLREKKLLIYIFICLFDIYMSGSRTVIILTAVAFSIIIFYRYKNKSLVRLVFVLAFCALLFAFFQSDFAAGLFGNFNDMFFARFAHWITAIEILLKSPVNFFCGVGLNNVVDYINEHFYEFHSLVAASDIITEEFAKTMPIHNSYLIVGAELGIIGFILYASIYIKLIIISLRNIKNKIFQSQYVYILVTTIVLAIYAIQGWASHSFCSWFLIVVLVAYAYKTEQFIMSTRNESYGKLI